MFVGLPSQNRVAVARFAPHTPQKQQQLLRALHSTKVSSRLIILHLSSSQFIISFSSICVFIFSAQVAVKTSNFAKMMHDESHHDFYLAAQPFVVGGASAMLASSCIHPIDLSKVRLQLFATLNPGKPRPSSLGILKEMVRTEGVASIYAGLSASLMRQAVYGTARIGLHRTISNELSARNKGKPLSFGTKMLSAICSGSIAVVAGTPFDVALVRMQADSMKAKENRRGYKNVFDAISRVTKEEGFGKLYSGLLPNVLRGVSVNVGMMACYDQVKTMHISCGRS